MLFLLATACVPPQSFEPGPVGRRAVINGLEEHSEHCPFGLSSFCTLGPLVDAAIEVATAEYDNGDGRVWLDDRADFERSVREHYRAHWDGMDGLGPIRARIAQIHDNPPLHRDGGVCVVQLGPQPGRLVVDSGHLVVRDPELPGALLDRAVAKAELARPPCASLEVHSVTSRVERDRVEVEHHVLPMKTTYVLAGR